VIEIFQKLEKTNMLSQRLMWTVWPAFLVAGLLELVVFGLFDPEDMHWFGEQMTLSREGVYTISFFVFWALSIVSSSLTLLLATNLNGIEAES
jgi:hypothetical protein